MAIAMHQWPDEPTRTPENNCLYEGETVLDGQRYSARSRRGAPFALARVLVAAGIPDQPVQVTHQGLRGHLSYHSLHRMAELTIEESDRVSVRLGRYRERPDFSRGKSENRGESPSLVPRPSLHEGGVPVLTNPRAAAAPSRWGIWFPGY